jgi:hypothetical protein
VEEDMSILVANANERHELLWLGEHTDPLLGRRWHTLGCPICGYQIELCLEPFKKIVTRRGDEDLTEQDIEQIMELSKAGRAEEARALMASQPGHYYTPGMIQELGIEVRQE